MIVVLFELQAINEQNQIYVDLVNKLTDQLSEMKGFISVECFHSTVNSKKVMSVTTWENEDAVEAWRNVSSHLSAQKLGRDQIFDNYRVRVASVIRDYGLHERVQAPQNILFDQMN